MKREVERLGASELDLLVVGGGIFGACAAWDAALRGLSVGLVDRADFGGATSANSFRFLHGGIRYLQHGDLIRLRQSSAARRAFLRIAPHLTRPAPVAIPTFGFGRRGKMVLRAGMGLYDLLTLDRNRGITEPSRRIPAAQFLSHWETLALFPALRDEPWLTGAAVYNDGQMYDPARLTLAVVRSAAAASAAVANYVAVRRFLRSGDRVTGVEAEDTLTGGRFQIRAKITLNAAGPYAETLLRQGLGLDLDPPGAYSRDACFVLKRDLLGVGCGLAIQGGSSDPDAKWSRGQRHLFLIPWRGVTIVGVWHTVFKGSPDQARVSPEELEGFVREVQEACPDLGLKTSDISQWNAGLVPFGENDPTAKDLRYGHRSRFIDHSKRHGLDGLLTLIGIRYTTGLVEATQAVDQVFHKLGRRPPPSEAERTPVCGGDLDGVWAAIGEASEACPWGAGRSAAEDLVRSYGSEWPRVVKLALESSSGPRRLDPERLLEGKTIFAIREEFAQKLVDIVLRRTGIAAVTAPSDAALELCASAAAQELGWSETKRREEVTEVQRLLAERSPWSRVAPAPSGVVVGEEQ